MRSPTSNLKLATNMSAVDIGGDFLHIFTKIFQGTIFVRCSFESAACIVESTVCAVAVRLLVWLAIIGAIIVNIVLLSILDFVSPNRVAFDPQRSIYYILARTLRGSGGMSPDTLSARILVLFWALCSLILLTSYVSNQAALTIAGSYNNSVSTVSDLLSSGFTFGTVTGSIIEEDLQHHTEHTLSAALAKGESFPIFREHSF